MIDHTQFITGPFHTIDEKARFAQQFVRFVESNFDTYREFPAWFYQRLSRTFGLEPLASLEDFTRRHFYNEKACLEFVRTALKWSSPGSPTHTYSDVERALQHYLRISLVEDRLRRIVDTEEGAIDRYRLEDLVRRYPDYARQLLESL